jgi:hypothetical protein
MSRNAILASIKSYQFCKHFIAILVALEAIQNISHFSEVPKRFQQIKMKGLKGAPDRVRKKIEVDLS